MQQFKSFPLIVLAAACLGISAQSCSDDIYSDEGEGQLKLKMIVNSEVTRADVNDAELADKCVVYISNSKGLIHRFKGIGNVPSDLWLKSGNYVAEAWTGDSVTASFDKKFYKAYQPFEINQGVNNVVLNCKIANVVASVNRDGISEEMLPKFTVTVANTRGELVFNADNISDAHGYFMMPNNDTELKYTIEGENIVGTQFVKTGTIPNVQRAHEYVLRLAYNPDENQHDVGGAFITVAIDDTELVVEDNIEIHALPQVAVIGHDISLPVAGPAMTFDDLFISASCYGNFTGVNFKVSDKNAFGTEYAEYDLLNLAETARAGLENSGVTWNFLYGEEGHSQMRLKMAAQMLNRLPDGDYAVTLRLTDGLGRAKEAVVNIKVSDASVAVLPVDRADIRSYSANVRATVLDESVTNPGIQFRKKGTAEWQKAVSATRSTEKTFRLTNLTPATTYELQAIADGYVNSAIVEFTTEAVYAIPNASFEDWSTYSFNGKNVPFPGTGNATTFWSSGNAGSMSMNKTVTVKATDMKHSGAASVKLQSQFVGVAGIGKFAAGNLFSGEYVETLGMDGHLLWGREIPVCHPVKLTGYAHYRNAEVQWSGTNKLPKGEMDKGTIYIAVTTEKVDVNTKTKVVFKPEGSDGSDGGSKYEVIAYGSLVWDSNFAPDGQLQKFEIPLEWRNAAYEGQMYLIIVASSSLYGDYFTGGNSVMYLDDLELVYE